MREPVDRPRPVFLLLVADDAFRIEGTYHETAGETLGFLLW